MKLQDRVRELEFASIVYQECPLALAKVGEQLKAARAELLKETVHD